MSDVKEADKLHGGGGGAAKLAGSREGLQLLPVTITAEPVSGVPAVASGPVGRMEIVLGAG
jgi:hypothetical protein